MRNGKNLLIGGLLAIVLVMAVGYAAFSTSLNINGTANIDSKWDVHFDQATSSAEGTPGKTAGGTNGVTPTGTVTASGTQATLNAQLKQPGDVVTFTIGVINAGTLDAVLGAPTISEAKNGSSENCTISSLTATCTNSEGTIQFSITSTNNTAVNKNNGKATITVTATFVNDTIAKSTTQPSASVKINLNATQKTS